MPDETHPTQKQAATLMAQTYALVQACPAGRVTTYGWLGKALGYLRGARMVGWIMNEAPHGVPAQRVINSKGELTGSWAFGQRGKMRQLLEAEGIVFFANETVDLKRYGWDPTRDLDEAALKNILDHAATTSVDVSERLLDLLHYDKASPFRGTAGEEK